VPTPARPTAIIARVRTRLTALGDLTPSDKQGWRELAERALEPNPSHEPDYVLPLAGALGHLRSAALLIVEDEDGWQAVLPVHGERWHRIPLRSRAAWRGHILYALLGTPLVAPGRPGAAIEALLEGMLRQGASPSFAALEEVAEGGPVAAHLLEAFAADDAPDGMLVERWPRATLVRRPEETYVEETLKPKRRRELRRQRRKLGEELGDEVVVVERAGDDAAYAELIRLEAAGRKGDRGTVLAADPAHARFFTEMCRAFAERGRLQILALQAAGRTLALQCNLLAGDAIFRVKIAYDEEWAAYSPGIQLELEGIRVFHDETDAAYMDSCADANNAMINRLWPDRRWVATYGVPQRGPRGWVAAPTLRVTRSLREWNRRRKG